jgi:ABC-type bacteriocin/lantibiotic exporter with double-glycine peptidase domain
VDSLFALVRRGFFHLSKSDRRKIYFVVPISVLLGLLDLIGVILLGTVGTLAFKSISNDSKPTKLELFLGNLFSGNISTINLTLILGIGAIFVLAAKTISQAIMNYKLAKFQARIETEIALKAFRKIIMSQASIFNSNKYSDYQYALTVGANRFVNGIIGSVIAFSSDLITTLIMASFAFYASPIAFLAAFIIFLFTYLLINGPIHNRSQLYGEEAAKIYISMSEHLLENFKGIKEISVYRQGDKLANAFNHEKGRSSILNQKMLWISSITRYFLEISILVSAMGIVGILLITTDIRHSITVLVIFMAIGFRLIPNIQRMQNSLVTIRIAEGTTKGLFSILDSVDRVNELEMRPQSSSTSFDFINVQNVCYDYPDSSGVLSDISFKLLKNKSLAIIGESGSGKTTLADLIAGINSPSIGTVTFEQFGSTENSSKSFPSIAYVSQNSSLFGDDIYENIAFGSNESIIDKEKIDSILNNLNLNFLVTDIHATGLRVLRSDGTNLSGGERQRIAIARSEYTDTQIVIFDEPTSSLDEANRVKVVDYIKRIKDKKTIIIVTHTLELLEYCDSVLQLEAGKLSFYGSTFDFKSQQITRT